MSVSKTLHTKYKGKDQTGKKIFMTHMLYLWHIMGKDWILNIRIFINKKNIAEKLYKHMNRWFTKEESQITNKYIVIILKCKSIQVCFYVVGLSRRQRLRAIIVSTGCERWGNSPSLIVRLITGANFSEGQLGCTCQNLEKRHPH